MQPASSKVLLRPKSALNPTSPSVSSGSYTTPKTNTAIFRFMSLANDSSTFPRIIWELWEVQVYLVRKPLRIRLRRIDLTGRDGDDDDKEVLNHLCGRLTSGSLELLRKKNGWVWETMDSTAWSKPRVDFPPPTSREGEQTSILQNMFIFGNTD